MKNMLNEKTNNQIEKAFDLLCSIYRQVNGSNPPDEIKNKIKSCLQGIVMETRISEYEKANNAA